MIAVVLFLVAGFLIGGVVSLVRQGATKFSISVVAALAYAEAQGLSEEEAVRLSTATGAANVMCSGTQAAEREAVEALLPQVRFSRLRP